jgi:hypothetical protein
MGDRFLTKALRFRFLFFAFCRLIRLPLFCCVLDCVQKKKEDGDEHEPWEEEAEEKAKDESEDDEFDESDEELDDARGSTRRTKSKSGRRKPSAARKRRSTSAVLLEADGIGDAVGGWTAIEEADDKDGVVRGGDVYSRAVAKLQVLQRASRFATCFSHLMKRICAVACWQLSSVPVTLPCRESEHDQVYSFLHNAIQRGGLANSLCTQQRAAEGAGRSGMESGRLQWRMRTEHVFVFCGLQILVECPAPAKQPPSNSAFASCTRSIARAYVTLASFTPSAPGS